MGCAKATRFLEKFLAKPGYPCECAVGTYCPHVPSDTDKDNAASARINGWREWSDRMSRAMGAVRA